MKTKISFSAAGKIYSVVELRDLKDLRNYAWRRFPDVVFPRTRGGIVDVINNIDPVAIRAE